MSSMRRILACSMLIPLGVTTIRAEQPTGPLVPRVSVLVRGPGFSVEELERQVLAPLGRQFVDSDGRAFAEVAVMRVFFPKRVTSLKAAREVKALLRFVRIPPETETLVLPYDIDSVRLRGYVLLSHSKGRSHSLSGVASAIRRRLDAISNIGAPLVLGETPSISRVTLDPAKLAGFGLTATDVERAIRLSTARLPGKIEEGEKEYLVRPETPPKLGDLVVKALPKGRAVKLADVAEVSEDRSPRSCRIGVQLGPDAEHRNAFAIPIVSSTADEKTLGGQIENILSGVKKSLPKEMRLEFVATDERALVIEVRTPEGLSLEQVGRTVERVGSVIRNSIPAKNRTFYFRQVGRGPVSTQAFESLVGSSSATIRVGLRGGSTNELVANLSRVLANKIPGVECGVYIGSKPTHNLAVRIRGEDLDQLLAVRDSVRERFSRQVGVSTIRALGGETIPSKRYVFHPQRLAELGLTLADASSQLRIALGEALPIYLGGDREVIVELAGGPTPEKVVLTVPKGGQRIPLSEVAKVAVVKEFVEIRHYRGERAVYLEMTIEGKPSNAKRLQEAVRSLQIPKGVTVELAR